jgi:hypothetical protein
MARRRRERRGRSRRRRGRMISMKRMIRGSRRSGWEEKEKTEEG